MYLLWSIFVVLWVSPHHNHLTLARNTYVPASSRLEQDGHEEPGSLLSYGEGSKTKRDAHVNLPQAWKTIFREFPVTVHDVMSNAEVRYAAEVNHERPIDWASRTKAPDGGVPYYEPAPEVLNMPSTVLVPPEHTCVRSTCFRTSYVKREADELADTLADELANELANSGATQVYSPNDRQAILGTSPFTGRVTHYSPVKRSAEADSTQVFNPNDRQKILGKIPFSGTTHFSQVSGRHHTQEHTQELQQHKQQVSGKHHSPEHTQQQQQQQHKQQVSGKHHTPEHTLLQQQQHKQEPLQQQQQKQQPKTQKQQPQQKLQKIQIQQEEEKESEDEVSQTALTPGGPLSVRARLQALQRLYPGRSKAKRDVDAMLEQMEQMDKMQKMMDNEELLDKAIHEVMGDAHESEAKDVAQLEALLHGMTDMHDAMHTKAAKSKSDVTSMMQNSIASMDSITKMLDEQEDREKALEDLISLDSDMKELVHSLVEPAELERVEQARSKRSNGVGYYDPDYAWLARELRLDGQDEADLYRIQQQIIRGDTSSSYAKYPGSPQYARASAQVSEILKEAGSTYRKETHQYPYAPYQQQQQRTVPSKHYTSYPQKPAQQHQQQAQAYYYEPTKHQEYQVPAYSSGAATKEARDKSLAQRLLESLYPIRDSMPTELAAAYHGAVEVGKHVSNRLKPIVTDSYKTVAYNYYPRAKISVAKAVDAVPKDIKDFARQGRKIVETRAKYVSEAARPGLNKLGEDLWQLQEQLKQVAEETTVYANKEVVPNIVPTLRGLLHDIQETLELANHIVEEDVKPLAKEYHRDLVVPVYAQVKTKVVDPATRKVQDYWIRPLTERMEDYVVQPIAERARPVYYDYARPAASTAATLAGSAVSGVSSAAESSRVVYQNSLKPGIKKFAHSTKQVLDSSVKPAVAEAATNVADRAARIGDSIQKEIVPPLKEGIKSTLHTVFTGLPKLVQKMSHEAEDAAKVFNGKYSEALHKMKTQEEKKKLEKEVIKNKVRNDEERKMEKIKQTVDKQDEEASIEDVQEEGESSESEVEDNEVGTEPDAGTKDKHKDVPEKNLKDSESATDAPIDSTTTPKPNTEHSTEL